MRKRFRTIYGASPQHLLALLASFAIAGAGVVGWFERPREVVSVLEWFAAAIVLHDLVLLPLYALIDRIAFGRRPTRVDRQRGKSVLGLVKSTPYLRLPAMLSGLLLAVFFPVILGLGTQTEFSASGIAENGYLARWLLATAAMFALSGLAYAVALARAVAARRPPAPDPGHATAGADSTHPAAPDLVQATAEAGAPQPTAPDPGPDAKSSQPAAPDADQTAPGEDGASAARPD